MQRTITFLAYFFVCTVTAAQQYPFVHYTPKDGLINSRVHKAYQDSKGRMYFLTYGGLSVYDGVRFKNYTTQDGVAASLVNDILEVGDDSLLLATNNGNFLNVLVRGKMKILKMSSTNIPVINQFYRHENGKIYLSSDYGLFILENNNIRKLNTSVLHGRNIDLANLGNITGVGNWLIIANNEMNPQLDFYLYDIEKNRICDSLSKPVYLVGKDEKNRIWASTSEKLFMLDSSALEKEKLLLTAPTGGYLQAKDYAAPNIAFGKNCIWVVHRDKEYKNIEIRRVEESGDLLKMPLPDKAMSSIIRNIFIDKENIIWLCNDGEGVFKIVNSPLHIFENPIGKSNRVFVDDAFYSGNTTWYSTNSNKLFRKSEQGSEEFNSNMKPAPEIFYNEGKKLTAHDNRNIYEGTLNSQKKSIDFHQIISLPDYELWGKKLLIDPNGNLIAIQTSGLGVWKNNKRIFLLPFQKPDIIDDLIFDKNNLLWAITRYSGIKVFKLRPENDPGYLQLVIHFTKDKIKGSPRCFVFDKTGLLWVGTRDDGVVCYRMEGNNLKQLHQFNTGNGLTDNFVTTLACDSLNNIIVGTQTGLDRVLYHDKNSYRVESLSKSSNFFIKINQVWADSKQAYALSFSGFLLQLSLLSNEKTQYAPQLLLEEMKVNAQSVSLEKQNFRYKENNISFFVAAPSFIDEKQVAFSYLLEGSGNKQWSDSTATNAIINLTNLSSGKYNLKVKAFFPSTSYIPAELSYPFEIFSPWWQTWWFRVSLGLLITGLLIITLRFYYKRKLERQKSILEKQQAIEKERTRIATDMHDDLGAGLSRIKFLSETIGIKKQQQQPIEEDISKIREYSHEMIDKMGEIVWALNEKNDSLSDLLSYSRSYAVEYLSQSGIECNVQAPDNFPSVFVSGEFRRNIYLVLKEALHNIVKHAQAGHVNITISINQQLTIWVHDDGIGIDKNSIRPFRNGLTNMEKRIKDMGGTILIENARASTDGNDSVGQGKGTIVQLSVPLSS